MEGVFRTRAKKKIRLRGGIRTGHLWKRRVFSFESKTCTKVARGASSNGTIASLGSTPSGTTIHVSTT